MHFSILFIVALILVSGFIAYFGDLLGRRMGKKRLTLFHMRPRYTAILFTVITGMLISSIALFALITVNSEFRKVFTQGEFILGQNKRLKTTNQQLDERNRRLADESVTLETQVKEARKQSEESLKARNIALVAVTKLEKDISTRKLELNVLKSQGRNMQAEIKVKQAKLRRVEASLVKWQRKLLEMSRQVLEAGRELLALNTKFATITAQLRDVESQALQMQKETFVLRSAPLVLRQGDEMARGAISTRQSIFAIKTDVFALLKSASTKAEKLGAGTGPNGRAVVVEFRHYASAEKGFIIRNEEACVDEAAGTIEDTGGYDSVVVQVLCASNTLQGEQVPVEIKLFTNHVVFHKDETIATTTVDGDMSEGRILIGVIQFLQRDVSRVALERGIIPVANPDPRLAPDTNSTAQVEALLRVVESVKTLNNRVELDVMASQDVYAIGPLNMDNMRFAVRKPK